MSESPRELARRLADEALKRGKPMDWFERYYAEAAKDRTKISWADYEPNPNIVSIFSELPDLPYVGKAIKVGCGFGDDAEWLALRGFDVTAFDISPTAINTCRKRFPDSRVNYQVADLFEVPSFWIGGFDLVLEAYTLQVLPEDIRGKAITRISSFVGEGGHLLVIARARDENDPPGSLPWPLLRTQVESFQEHGLKLLHFDDFMDCEQPPVRRFTACFRRE